MPNADTASFIYLEDISKSYGAKVVLDDIDLSVRQGEFCTVVGPSGCGKSTLLRLILGQEKCTTGRVMMDGKEIQLPSPDRGIVYQQYSLFPHLTILENIMLGKLLSRPFWERLTHKRKAREEAHSYLESVQLGAHANKYPHELSGGMRQRVAIAQALIMKPKILMMDEPFGALDPGTREAMQVLILELWEKHGMTLFFVTHDLEEAVFLGTRILVISQYYMDKRGSSPEVQRGSRIVADYPLKRSTAVSTRIKETAEFGKLIQTIRSDGFDPSYLQHVTQFNLRHSDSFQTLSDDIQ